MRNGNDKVQHPAVCLLPKGLFLMTAAHEAKRAGALVESVQACGTDSPLICVTMRKGHWIEPLIRDSHAFAICIFDPADKLISRKFVQVGGARETGDPFDCFPVEKLITGAPIVRRAIAAIDCRVARHLDVDLDHALYVGTVVASRVFTPQADAPLSRSERSSMSA